MAIWIISSFSCNTDMDMDSFMVRRYACTGLMVFAQVNCLGFLHTTKLEYTKFIPPSKSLNPPQFLFTKQRDTLPDLGMGGD